MSKRNETPKARTTPVAEPVMLSSDATLRSLEQIIEAERAQLLQAHSVIKCVYEVLLYSDGENALHHADAANIAAQLIDGVAERLESIKLREKLKEMERALDDLPEVTLMHGDGCVRDVAWTPPEPGTRH